MDKLSRVAIYARFSSEKQSERSIEDQIVLCRDFCKRHGLYVVAVYDDRAISGASTVNRSGWLQLMADSRKANFDVVVAESLDRISRDQEDLAAIYKRLRFQKIDIRTVQDGPVGEMHVGIKGLLGALFLKDLAQKTKRGQAGVVRDGRHNGGRSYGYRAVPGQPGQLEVLPNESDVVRRIFDNYLAGHSPRDIASGLNSEGIPGPRGRHWNASTIAGSRKRQNGILQNALYIGRIVWNRQSFIKDPDTGRRISRPNPKSEWLEANAPKLRIIDDAVWTKVQNKRAQRGGERHHRARPKRLLSGLLKCGLCGSGYVVSGADKRGPYLRCSRMVETGLCENRRTISVEAIEAIVIDGIENHLGSPHFVAEYVREFHLALAELDQAATQRRSQLSNQLRQTAANIDKIVGLLLTGTPSRALKERLAALERQRDDLEKAIGDLAPPPIKLDPKAPETYRAKVKDLKVALGALDDENRNKAHQAIRDLVQRVVIRPAGAYKPAQIDIYGSIQALLDAPDPDSVGVLVAGVGFEPTTFRL